MSRLDRLAGRFNRWFGGTAVAANVPNSGTLGGGPSVDASAVVGALGELEGQHDSQDDDGRRHQPG
jgi:hypothetical protein